MDPKEIARVLSRHDCIGEKSAETIARGDAGKTWVEPAGIAIALLALESRLADAEGERDALAANGPAIVAALEERNVARAERDTAKARFASIKKAAGKVAESARRVECYDCATSQGAPCATCGPLASALATLRTALAALESEVGE